MGRECKVLIVDDEFITRQGISHMIMWEQEGFLLVGEASNGQEGIEMIEKYQPDIVLADIVMVRLAAHVSNGLKSRIRPVVGRI